jgi:hypothetical protein
MMQRVLVATVMLGAALAACSDIGDAPTAQPGTVLSEGGPGRERSVNTGAGGGFSAIFGGGGGGDETGAVLGVNAYLWRASLDTVSFLPITSADPFGGVILSDYYTPPETPNARYKVAVYILGRELRSDNVRVSITMQTRAGSGWRDEAANETLARQLEDTILARARQLRIAGLNAARS